MRDFNYKFKYQARVIITMRCINRIIKSVTHVNEEFERALFYGFLGMLGKMFLNSSSPNEVLATSWIGNFLFTYGLIVLIFFGLEHFSPSDEHQKELTIISLLIITGAVITNFGIDGFKILGAITLSIATGRALTLIFNLIIHIID